MNEQQFDELFSSKLKGLTQTPSDRALEQINQKIYRRRRIIWINYGKIAAVVLIVAISIGIVNQWDPIEVERPITDKTIAPIPSVAPPERMITEGPKKEKLPVIKQQPAENIPAPVEETIHTKNTATTTVKVDEGSQIKQKVLLSESGVSVKQAAETGPIGVTQNAQADEKKKVTITYIRSSTTETPLAEAEQPTKSNGIKKLWKKAVVNQSSFSLATIRATKDELLAINRKGKPSDNKPD